MVMKYYSALFSLLLIFVCISSLHTPDGNNDAFSDPLADSDFEPVLPEASSSDVKLKETRELPLLADSLTTSSKVFSSVLSSTSELEELVTATVAPATPSYDADLSFTAINSASSSESHSQSSEYVLSSVILIPPSNPSQIQSSQGSQNGKVSTFSEGVLPTKEPEVLPSVLDSVPPKTISSDPSPSTPSETTRKEDEDSITAALNQAEEETKLKEEEMPSFDEFKRRVLQEEEEKSKQLSVENLGGVVQKPKKLKERKQSNYASVDCGAKILDHNSEASNADSILVENRDLYMLNPCSAQVWFVVELCDLAQVKSIQIANFELFSSTPESFRVYVSKRYPTREWTMLGTFQAREERTIQTFPLDEPIYAKYFKVEMLSHFGSEHYCPLSLLRVHGSSMMEELEDHETDGQEDSYGSDSDNDVPVLPPNPSANVEDQPKKQNLLERAADTVISLVKKFTGDGHDNEKGEEEREVKLNVPDNKITPPESNSQDESKGKIVTLVGHEELNESLEESSGNVGGVEHGHSRERNTSQGESVSDNISQEDGSFCSKSDNEEDSRTTSPAPSACQLFAQVLGHYSLGCFVGRILFSQNENFTLSMNLATSGNYKKRSISLIHEKQKNESYEDKENKNQEKVPAENVAMPEEPSSVREKPSTVGNSKEKGAASEITNQGFSSIIPETSSSSVETLSEVTVSPASEVVENIDASSRGLQPSESINVLITGDEKNRLTDDKTPSLEEVTPVTSLPVNATMSASVTLKSSEASRNMDSVVDVVQDESRLHDKRESNRQPVKNISESPLPVIGEEHAPLVTKGTPQQQVPSDVKDINSNVEEKREDNLKVNGTDEGKTEATPSESKTPNSIHIMSQSSDIDVLETKLTDKDGREGTAQLPEEVHYDKHPVQSVNEASESMKAADSSSVKLEIDGTNDKGLKPDLVAQEQVSESTASSSTLLESQSVDSVAQPTTPPSIESPDTLDPILPLPAPPIIADASVTSHDFAAATSSEANLDASVLSKSQQAAASTAGMSSVMGPGGHKESIFVRLSNKIKALEQNLNMSTLYMEQLHQRYRKSLDELQKTSDKKVALLTNATKKAEAIINSQKEHITTLQSKLDNLTHVVADIKARMDPLNKEVMERHVIGLCIEIVLILLLFLLFAKRISNQVTSNSPGRSVHFMNGHGPPRLAIEDSKRDKGTILSAVPMLSGREQLLHSFGKVPEPDSIGASTDTDNLDNKLPMADSCSLSESKRKRHRKRKGSSTAEPTPDNPSYWASNEPELLPESHSGTDAPSSAGAVSRNAGLLFSSPRGFFGGLPSPWKQPKPSVVHSDPNLSARTELNRVAKSPLRPSNPGISRAKSLDLAPAGDSRQKHAAQPAPEFGVMLKRSTDCFFPKRGTAKNILPGPVKYGKYGVLDTQLA